MLCHVFPTLRLAQAVAHKQLSMLQLLLCLFPMQHLFQKTYTNYPTKVTAALTQATGHSATEQVNCVLCLPCHVFGNPQGRDWA